MTGSSDADVRADVRAQIREFLTGRRARITPQQAGLPVFDSTRRRVPGLRREEAALLAGISNEYYVRLERGDATGISEGVIEGIVHALRLDDAERSHFLDLLRLAGSGRDARKRAAAQQVRPSVQRIIDAMVGLPAFVLNGRLDVLASNGLGRALYGPMFADGAETPNNARFIFLDQQATVFWTNWDKAADDTVAMLRTEAGRNPYDRELSDLVGELSTRSEEFRRRWADHDVRLHVTGRKAIDHPLVGHLDLPFEFLPLPGDPGQSLLTYTAEPGSPTQQALDRLAGCVGNGVHRGNAEAGRSVVASDD